MRVRARVDLFVYGQVWPDVHQQQQEVLLSEVELCVRACERASAGASELACVRACVKCVFVHVARCGQMLAPGGLVVPTPGA